MTDTDIKALINSRIESLSSFYFCNKCGATPKQAEHEGCNYDAVASVDVDNFKKVINYIEQLEKERDEAIARVKDMYEGDDGQAWKEARKFLESLESK